MTDHNSAQDSATLLEWRYTRAVTKRDLTRLALELPLDEQLELAQTLWENASPPVSVALPAELEKLLDSRLIEARTDPEAGVPWEEVKARLLNRA